MPLLYQFLKTGLHQQRGRKQKREELYDLVKQHSDSAYDSVVYNQVKTGSSESPAEAEELNQS